MIHFQATQTVKVTRVLDVSPGFKYLLKEALFPSYSDRAPSKVMAIRALREEFPGLGLKEAKDMVDSMTRDSFDPMAMPTDDQITAEEASKIIQSFFNQG